MLKAPHIPIKKEWLVFLADHLKPVRASTISLSRIVKESEESVRVWNIRLNPRRTE